MSTEFTPLQERFEALAGQLTVPGPIDLDKAMSQGRQARVRRRTKVAGFAATGLAAVAALTLAAVNLHSPVEPAPATVVPLDTFSRTATDPVAVGVSFGWLPAGMLADGYATLPGPNGTGVMWVDAQSNTPASALLQIREDPAGPRPNLSLEITPPEKLVTTAGPSINGHASYIESIPGTPTDLSSGAPYYLTWQFDDGKWAELYVQGPSNSGFNAMEVTRIAQGVTEKPHPIPENFQIDGALAAADIVNVTISMKTGPELTLRAGSAEIQITLGPATSSSTRSCKTAVYFPEGICVSVHGNLPPALASGGLRGLLDDVTLLEFPTVDVIR